MPLPKQPVLQTSLLDWHDAEINLDVIPTTVPGYD